MILSEYASTEMSLHALYMHEVSNPELGMEQGRQGTALSVVTRKPVCMQCCREGVFGHLVSPTQLSRSCFGLQLHKQHAQLEPERHTWHRRESDESGESAHEELDAQGVAPSPFPALPATPSPHHGSLLRRRPHCRLVSSGDMVASQVQEPGQRSEFRSELCNRCPLWTGTSSLPAVRHWQSPRQLI